MPRPRNPLPTYSLHRPSGQAYVRIPDGPHRRRVVYLGRHGSPESRAEYARLIAGLAATPAETVPLPARATPHLSVNELMVLFLRHADRHYRRADGSLTNELGQFRQTFRVLRELAGHTPATEFGPRALKAVRDRMIAVGWCRTLVNQRVGRVKRLFRWAVSEELIPPQTFQGLTAVGGLQAGRSTARETGPVAPVADAHVRATLPYLPSPVRAMVEVQLLTGMRPGEVCRLRPADVDASGAVWVYRPAQFKTRHRNGTRVIAIGPRAQAVLGRFAPENPTDHYFSPRQATAEHHAGRAAVRRTPRYPSHQAHTAAKRKADPARVPGDAYTVTSYGRAVARAVVRVNRGYVEAGVEVEHHLPHWHPNQLRHAHATRVRQEFGLEAAQVSLGHARADVTQVYAELDLSLAVRVALELG